MPDDDAPPPPAAGPLAYATPAAERPRRAMLAAVAVAAVLVAVRQGASLAAWAELFDAMFRPPLMVRLQTVPAIAHLVGDIVQAAAGLAAGVLAGLSVAPGRPARGLPAALWTLAAGGLLVNGASAMQVVGFGLGPVDAVRWGTSAAATAVMWAALALACRRTRPA